MQMSLQIDSPASTPSGGPVALDLKRLGTSLHQVWCIEIIDMMTRIKTKKM